MRRLATVAALALLTAFSAQAQPAPPPKVPPAQPAKPAPAPVPVLPSYVGPAVAPRSPLPNSAADDASAQCSATCGRAYYQCLAGDNADLCSGDWAQCRARCGAIARRSGG